MTPHRRPYAAVVIGALALIGAGCTGTDSPPASSAPQAPASVLSPVECPADVAASVVGEVSCALLTAPESRSRPESTRTVELLVTTVHAPDGVPEREPMLVPGSFRQPNYAGIAGLAQRVGRDVILVDGRGSGHSTPSLACPEVASVPDAWAGGPRARQSITAAVRACYERLAADGVDLGAYDLANTVADLEDLRTALGLDQWNVGTYGLESRVALELVRVAPDSVRALVLDSPDVPGTDPRAIAGPTTEQAVRRVLAACAADQSCGNRYPDPVSLLDRAMRSLRPPLRLRVPVDGDDTVLLFDQGFLARALRQMLSDGGSSGALFTVASVPSLLAAVAAGDRARLADAAEDFVRYEGPLCLGYRTPCLPAITGSLGAELTTLCRDIAPFAAERVTGLGPGFRQAYGRSPWWQLCDSWPVDAADPAIASAPADDVPTLVVLGGFAPYSPERIVRRGLAGLTQASYVVVPGRPHNALPNACAGEVRNRWVDDPVLHPKNPCPREEPISWN